MRTGVYPGSFDPPTVAHLAVAEAALAAGRLDRIVWVVSQQALGKEGRHTATADERVLALTALAGERPWLSARVTSERLLADISEGYDTLVVGADKWAQVIDPAWYGGSPEARDAALARLPGVLVAPRPPHPLPPVGGPVVAVLELHPVHAEVSSTAVRGGRTEWLAPGVEWAPEASATSPEDPQDYCRRMPGATNT